MELKYKHLYKTVLKEYQNLSKCARLKVAALLVEEGRIISCGYNGTPSGQTNCNELFKVEADKYYYRSNGKDLPISAAASSIREIAPLALLVERYDVSTISILFEEPEAHLHPLKQRMMADIISALNNAGAYMQITTHKKR